MDETKVAELLKLRGCGMVSAVGEYTPNELWEALDCIEGLRADSALLAWVPVAKHLPTTDGEYLCWVRVPKRMHGKFPKLAHFRYMALEFVGGGFWISGGMPQGMVTHWLRLEPPNG